MGRTEYTYEGLSEIDLMSMLREGNERALTFVYDKHKQRVCSYLRSIRISLPVEDVYQEAFMVMLSNVYEKDLKCKIGTFLYSVAKNISLKELRKLGRESDVEIVNVKEEIDEYNEETIRLDKLRGALKKIGEKCKSIIENFYINNWSMEDIAEKFGYTNSLNAKNQKYKCMKKLKEILDV